MSKSSIAMAAFVAIIVTWFALNHEQRLEQIEQVQQSYGKTILL